MIRTRVPFGISGWAGRLGCLAAARNGGLTACTGVFACTRALHAFANALGTGAGAWGTDAGTFGSAAAALGACVSLLGAGTGAGAIPGRPRIGGTLADICGELFGEAFGDALGPATSSWVNFTEEASCAAAATLVAARDEPAVATNGLVPFCDFS